jgi:putative flavoprotein involved in K+ transport
VTRRADVLPLVGAASEAAMKRLDTIVIGAGQAGLAMSRCLSDRGLAHVVLERGRVAERWRSERWDSLKLLTPRWQSRLPGWSYQGTDPHGYMNMPEVIDYLDGYARTLPVPVEEKTRVERIERTESGFVVITDRGEFRADSVVLATGACQESFVPSMAEHLASAVAQVLPTRYRRPSELPDGGVLVVGAGATGVQLADEIHRSGRPVTLSVGAHVRLPREYRGADIMWWLDAMGVLDRRAEDVRALDAARRAPSMQLVGREDHASLDLETLSAEGVRICGRTVAVDGHRVSLATDLATSLADADSRLERMLDRIDAFASERGLDGQIRESSRPPRVRPRAHPDSLDLAREGIRAVVWATGYRRRYPFLAPRLAEQVLGKDGELRHQSGVTTVPGLYALGLPLLRKRKSTFIDGVGDDARALADHITLRARRTIAA